MIYKLLKKLLKAECRSQEALSEGRRDATASRESRPGQSDGNPVHLLRLPHGKRRATARQDWATILTVHVRLKRKHAYGNLILIGEPCTSCSKRKQKACEKTGMECGTVNRVHR